MNHNVETDRINWARVKARLLDRDDQKLLLAELMRMHPHVVSRELGKMVSEEHGRRIEARASMST